MKNMILTVLMVLGFTNGINAAYPPYVQNVVIPQKTIEFDKRYFQGQDYYYSVGEKLEKNKVEEKDAQIEFYKGQLDLILKILAAKTGVELTPGNIPTPSPSPSPSPTPESPPSEEGEYKVTELDKKVYSIFKNQCARCHGDTKQDGGIALIKNDVLQLVDIFDRVEIHDRVNGIGLEARGKTRMPKGSSPLADAYVETLRLWAVEESDRNRLK
jgi:mono/diheme cytochrome c family protein